MIENIGFVCAIFLLGIGLIILEVLAVNDLNKTVGLYEEQVNKIEKCVHDVITEQDKLTKCINIKIKDLEKKSPKIIFICDGEACDQYKDYCTHTADINHAANFTKVDDELYVEGGLDDI